MSIQSEVTSVAEAGRSYGEVLWRSIEIAWAAGLKKDRLTLVFCQQIEALRDEFTGEAGALFEAEAYRAISSMQDATTRKEWDVRRSDTWAAYANALQDAMQDEAA